MGIDSVAVGSGVSVANGVGVRVGEGGKMGVATDTASSFVPPNRLQPTSKKMIKTSEVRRMSDVRVMLLPISSILKLSFFM